MIKKCCMFIACAIAFSVLGNAAHAQSSTPQVTIDSGKLSGTADAAGALVFKGIPYARPPVGALRWREPQPPVSWSGVRDASDFGDRCMQGPFPSYIPIGKSGMSEDCLYLNVWTSPHASKLPVLVWIHGGGLGYGFSNQSTYDGDSYVRKGLVYVDLNYRVGSFGFLAHPDLTRESPDKTSGNYGILDQLAALRWVKRNIANFGGDPNNVTIFGESGGSISVTVLTSSPLAKGLFKRAIGDSGAGLGLNTDILPVRPLAWAEKRGIAFTAAAHVSSITELRALSAAQVMELGENGPGLLFIPQVFGPTIDGYVLKEAPSATFSRGAQNNVALIAGWNLNEGNLFMRNPHHPALCVPVWTNSKTPAAFEAQAAQSFGSAAPDFLRLRPHADDAQAKASAEFTVGDVYIAYETWKWADLQQRSGKTTAYVYFFAKRPPIESPFHLATHGAEVPYAFDNLDQLNWSWDATDPIVAHLMSSYYANFAKTGNPNGPGLPLWPAYETPNPQHIVFDEHGATAAALPLGTLRLIDEHYAPDPLCANNR